MWLHDWPFPTSPASLTTPHLFKRYCFINSGGAPSVSGTPLGAIKEEGMEVSSHCGCFLSFLFKMWYLGQRHWQHLEQNLRPFGRPVWIEIYKFWFAGDFIYTSKAEERCSECLFKFQCSLTAVVIYTFLSSAWDIPCPSLCLTQHYPLRSAWISCLLGRLPSLTSYVGSEGTIPRCVAIKTLTALYHGCRPWLLQTLEEPRLGLSFHNRIPRNKPRV